MNQWAASVKLHQSPSLSHEEEHEKGRELGILSGEPSWNPERFAQEQIRGLVRQVFLSGAKDSVRQVVFAAVEPQTDLRNICRMVGDALAAEDVGNVALVGNYPRLCGSSNTVDHGNPEHSTRAIWQQASQLRANLWLVPAVPTKGSATAESRSLLCDVRREFDFAIFQTSSAGSLPWLTAAQLADGVILVLSERRTRRAAALTLKGSIEAAHVRILGAVLSDRMFPIPEKIYRCL